MTCTTHHYACACREAKIRKMCAILLDQGLFRHAKISLAQQIATDLYGADPRDRLAKNPNRVNQPWEKIGEGTE